MLSFKQYLVLLEDKIDFLKNQYRDKLSTDHDQFAEHKGSDAIIDHLSTASKTYLPWVVKQYSQGKIKQEDVPQIRDTLELFDKHKRNLEKKDVNQYQNIGEIRDAIKPHIGTATTKREQQQYEEDVNHELIHEEPGFKVYHTRSKTASQNIYGGGSHIGNTDWCTAARGMQNMFDAYNSQGNLYQIHAKNPDGTESLYQYHPSSDGQFKDARDEDVNMYRFVEKHPQMKNVLAFKGSHDALPLSHEELTQMIQDGTYTTDHLGYVKRGQFDLMPEALLKKIQSGAYRFHDLDHAERNGYLNKDHLESLPEGLLKKIKNGTYDSWDLKHSKDNNYLNDDHLEALKYAYMKKLKGNNDHGLNEIDGAKEYGYLMPQHESQIQKNMSKWFAKHGMDSTHNAEEAIKKLIEHNLFNDEHSQIIKREIDRKFDDNNITENDVNFCRKLASDGLMTPKIQNYADKIENINQGKITENEINDIVNNIHSPGNHYLAALAYTNGYKHLIPDETINTVAANSTSDDIGSLLLHSHAKGNIIPDNALISLVKYPNFIDSYRTQLLLKAHEKGYAVPDEALNFISKESKDSHGSLVHMWSNGIRIPSDTLINICNHPGSTHQHSYIASHYSRTGEYLPDEAINAIAEHPYGQGAHYHLAQAYNQKRHIPNKALISILSNPESTKPARMLRLAHYDRPLPDEVINAIGGFG